MHRRTFLTGGTLGLTLVAVVGCTSPQPDPDPKPPSSAPPTPAPLPVPMPAGMARSTWTTDPYSRGAFSFVGIGSASTERSSLGEPVENRVFFAGEATSFDLPATVAGARRTGVRAALEVTAIADSDERIAVIGAGVAGATAARHLADEGFDVTVLEARERVGGRILTRDDDDWGVPIELGAGSFDSVSAPELAVKIEELEILTLTLDQSSTQRSSGGRELEASTVAPDRVRAAVTAAANLPGDISLSIALAELPVDPLGAGPSESPSAGPSEGPDDAISGVDRMESHLRNAIGVAYGADADELSAKNGLDDGPRESDTLVVGGYSTLVTDALDGLEVWTTNVVSAVGYGDDGVSIRLASGESLQVDRVVITVPLGVLKSGDIRFTPRLPPEHSAAITGLEMGSVEKLWLRFDDAFWDTDAVHWTTIGGDLDITEWINLEPSTGSPILVGLVGGERAFAIADLSDDELIERARRSLEPFLAT